MMYESDNARLGIERRGEHYGFVTFVKHGDEWIQTTPLINNPLSNLHATESDANMLGGAGDNFHWRATVSEQSGGFRWDITLDVERRIELNPSMILWLGTLDNMNDRQAHTWR